MATAVTDTRYTPEDLLALPDAGRYELIDGQLVERSLGATSSYVAARLVRLLGLTTDAQALGLLFGSDCGYQIFADDPSCVRYADSSFIRRGRLSGLRREATGDGRFHVPVRRAPGAHLRRRRRRGRAAQAAAQLIQPRRS